MAVDWAAVYRQTYQDLVRFLHRLVWDADQAQDLAQETFARALGETPDNPRAWLFRVATNLARDEARMHARRKRHLVLIKGEAKARQEGAADPLEAAVRHERQAAVRTALASLSERDRTALLLWDAGLDYHEIATETGLSPGAVGTTLARARRRLVDAYEGLETRHAAH